MHYKRKKPKEHIIIDCCRPEATWCSGNHRGRIPIRDWKQPQMYNGDHDDNVYRYYKNIWAGG